MPFAPIITPATLTNKVYQEVINTITRNTPEITEEAIDTGIQEAKMYLSRYDLVALFGDQTEAVSATFTDKYLTNLVKDLILWHLFSLSNVNISLELARTRYKDATDTLMRIQTGKVNPAWPYIDKSTQPDSPTGDEAYVSGFPKRTNNF